jgi:DNA-binding beta-propeller fold protein YncE
VAGKGILGVLVVTKSRNSRFGLLLSLSAVVLLAVAGCGGGSNTNVVTVAVSPSSTTIIVSQSTTFTSIVSGATDLNVTWACTFTTTTFDSAGKATTAAEQPCNSDTGGIPANSANTTVIYTAPGKVPDPTKFPNLQVIITAKSVQDPKKTGKATLTLDSGIVVTLTPTTATVPTSVSSTLQSQFQFSATLTNDNDPQTHGVTWLVTQGTPTSTLPFPSLTSCSVSGNASGCGSIDANGLYTAPTAVPTTATLTVVVASKADPSRFAIGSITIIQGGPISLKQISPTVAPQGASSYDIYIEAANMTSASSIALTSSGGSTTPINSASGQIKILFPIPTSTVANPASTGARLRLNVTNLATADTYTVSISDPAQCPGGCPLSTGHGPVSFQVLPVRPTSVATLPDSVPQHNLLPNELSLAVDGGYFGPSGSLAKITFNGNDLTTDATNSSSRQLRATLQSSDVSAALPGLYPFTVSRTSAPLPSPANPSVTNIAVFPDYSTVPPSVVGAGISAGTNPSAVDIDTRLGILAVAETGSNLVQFFGVGAGSLTPLPCPTSSCAVNAPTGLSINQANHTVAVVSPQDQSVVVLPLPGSTGVAGITYPLTISLSGLLPTLSSPALPYSVGVDSDTNMALVAYSSSANPTTAKVGFLLDLNKDTQTCLSGSAQTSAPCPHAQVTLNTGSYPQIAMLPHSHLALVTPGGSGVLNGIDVTKSSASVPIQNVSLTSGLVTVTTPSDKPHGLNPGNPGTVLIQGVPPGAQNQTAFNGAFTVQSVINPTSFTYALNSTTNDTATGDSDSFAYFSSPNITIGISQTTQGIAINPVTRIAAIADANATGNNGPQINLLNSLDQSVSSITFHAECTAFTTSCSGAPELLGTSSIAFQPYTNSLVSYNPQQNEVSVSNPVTQNRYAVFSVGSPNSTLPTVSVNGSSLTLFGGLAVDPATNQAFVVQSSNSAIQIINLGPTPSTTLKTAQITELQVPTVSGALIGGIVGALMPQGTLVSTADLAGVKIFGSGFDSGSQVRLDGTTFASTGLGNFNLVSSREIDVTIPHSFLAAPHRYAVDVVNGSGVRSNVTDFFVIKSVDMSKNAQVCKDSSGNFVDAQPNSIAIADQLPGQAFSPIAVVSSTACNNISVIDINPQSTTFGAVKSSIATGTAPQGVAVSPRFGLAVVANHTDGTASILDLATGTQKVAAVTVGSTPTGVAINEGTGAALVTNTGSNSVSEINLALLFGSSPPTTLTATPIAVDTSPIAIAIDPDRGTNSRGLAVVTALQLISGSAPIGVLDALDIGGVSPAKSTTAAVGTVTATPTGIVFNPSVSPALFYATSSGGNVVTAFNPDSGGTSTVHVGINPTSLAINPQTGGIMTVNSASQTVSIIDTISNPFKTRSTFGLGGSPQFGVAIDQFTNLAVIADQANNRVLIFPVPN